MPPLKTYVYQHTINSIEVTIKAYNEHEAMGMLINTVKNSSFFKLISK